MKPRENIKGPLFGFRCFKLGFGPFLAFGTDWPRVRVFTV